MQESPDGDSTPPSKSQRKRDMQETRELGKQLVALSEKQLGDFDLPEPLLTAIQQAQKLPKRDALRRQLQYIAKQLHDLDTETIRNQLELLDHQSMAARQQFHRVEGWRDRILSEGDPAIDQLMATTPNADRQHLRTLFRQAQREARAEKPPTAARKLFAYLRDLLSP